jgi:hypothetical protein
MEVKLTLTSTEHKDLITYCNLNDLLVSSVVKDSFTTGFNIERYGLLNSGEKVVEKEIIKEVIKRVEVPVEVEKEVVKIEYVEVPVEKIVHITDQEEIKLKIFQKEQEFDQERRLFSTKVQEMENIFQNEKKELFGKIKQLESKEPEIIEVIKEVKVEVPVEKIVYIYDKKEEEVVTNLDNICDKPEPEIKEIIIEKIVEVIKEVEKIVEVPVEVIREVIIEKEVGGNLQPKLDALQNTVQKLKQDNIEKDKKIKEYEKTIQDIQKFNEDKRAMFLSGSNLEKPLIK